MEDIYRTFNIDHPADFKGHSLSVSDVVVLHQGGKDTAHYCESFGFQQVPEFLRENPLRTAELSTEQNENMIDGVINNTPSMGELEAKVKAGEQISLTDLADATKAEAKKPKAKQSRKTQQKKPSIRARLKATLTLTRVFSSGPLPAIRPWTRPCCGCPGPPGRTASGNVMCS